MWSHSRVSTFDNCPKQYWFRYVAPRGAHRSRGQSIEAYMGSVVHRVLETVYHHTRRSGPPTREQAVGALVNWFAEGLSNPRRPVYIVRAGETAAQYLERARRCLDNFWSRWRPEHVEKTLGLEVQLYFKVGGQDWQGILDRLVRVGPGEYQIHDYKTSARAKTQEQAERDGQLGLYAEGLRQAYPDAECIDTFHWFLQPGVVVATHVTPQRLEAVRADFTRATERILAATKWPAKPSALCRWCEFAEQCPEAWR